MKEASLVKDCFPDPPTPTNRALPRGRRMILDILIKCTIASCMGKIISVNGGRLVKINDLSLIIKNNDQTFKLLKAGMEVLK